MFKEDKVEYFWILVIICTFLSIAHAVFNTAKAHGLREIKPPAVYEYPDIPKCDKELWLRIKDGCKDE